MKPYAIAVLTAMIVLSMIGAAVHAQVAPRRVERYYNPVQRGARSGVPTQAVSGAWWTNTALVTRLGLTDDQKTKIERAFENHRARITSATELLEREEAQLARLLAADPIDRNAVLSQIDRVVQARGEVERANSAMTLEMREYLTRAQWMQLQGPQAVRMSGAALLPNLLNRVEPVYPPLAQHARVQGVVVIEADITKEGAVENARALSGHPLLTQATVDAVKQWRFKPIMLNGEPVAVTGAININFPFSWTEGLGRGPAQVPGQRQGGGRGQRQQ